MKTSLSKKDKARVTDWCGGWFDLPEDRRCTLEYWIQLKLGFTTRKSQRAAEWMREERAAQNVSEP